MTGKGPCLYDEVTRIPLMVRRPGLTTPDTVFAQPVSHIYVTPNLLLQNHQSHAPCFDCRSRGIFPLPLPLVRFYSIPRRVFLLVFCLPPNIISPLTKCAHFVNGLGGAGNGYRS